MTARPHPTRTLSIRHLVVVGVMALATLAAAGKAMEDHTIRKQAERFLPEAKRQVMSETH